jgi:hypothetical protein
MLYPPQATAMGCGRKLALHQMKEVKAMQGMVYRKTKVRQRRVYSSPALDIRFQ